MKRIGIPSCIWHVHEPQDQYPGKVLFFTEEHLTHWCLPFGVVPVVFPIPIATHFHAELVKHYADMIDGLLLHGGEDMSPKSYGEEALHPDWRGDHVRDSFELKLIDAMIQQNKPILGICRGHQVINVYFGGTLYQDIPTMMPSKVSHRYPKGDGHIFEKIEHTIKFTEGSWLEQAFGKEGEFRVNSVHHQAVKRLGAGLAVEAISEDGIVEAIRSTGKLFIKGYQFHPEFHVTKPKLLSPDILMRDFVNAVNAKN